MRRLAITLAAAALLGFAMLTWIAQRAMYFPSRYPEGAWQAQSMLGAEDVWLQAAGGTRLHAWWIPTPEAKLATLHLHGNGGNITHRTMAAMGIRAAGSSVLLLDYRGYGRSEGSPSEQGLYADADAAYDWLRQRQPAIVIHGESLGSSVAVDLAVRKPCKGVVLESPFTSAGDVAHRVLPYLGPMVVRSFNTISKIGRVRAPLFFLHGDRDEVIDYSMGRALYEAAPQPKTFWTVQGAGHNDIHLVAGPEYAERLKAFYDSL